MPNGTVDASHSFGNDLQVSPTGDILVSSGPQLTQERVLRRLLTAAGSYLWFPNYGAGLPSFIGQPVSSSRIKAVIKRQMGREATVASAPPPSVGTSVSPDGTAYAFIRYTDASTGETQILMLPNGDAP